MISLSIYLLTALFLTKSSQYLIKKSAYSSVAPLILIYYSILLSFCIIYPQNLVDGGIPLSENAETNPYAALVFSTSAIFLTLGIITTAALLPNRLSTEFDQTPNRQNKFRLDLILLAGLAAAIASLLIPGAQSYAEYVEGNIGLKVSAALISAGAIPAAFLRHRTRMATISGLVLSIPCIVIGYKTGVRLLLFIPIATGLCTFITLGYRNIITWRNLTLVIIGLFPLAVVNSLVLIPLRGVSGSPLILPEANVVGWFLAYYDHVVPNQSWSIDPINRLIEGISSYPLSKLGYSIQLSDDPAHFWAREILQVGPSGPYHMPMTLALDLHVSSGPFLWISAFIIGVIIYLIEYVSRLTLTSRLMAIPALTLISLLLTRGSITHAGTTTSAVIIFIFGIALIIEGASFFQNNFEVKRA